MKKLWVPGGILAFALTLLNVGLIMSGSSYWRVIEAWVIVFGIILLFLVFFHFLIEGVSG